jgi:hypothetical protein
MPIRILQVVHGLPRGGLENGVVNLLYHLPADEFEHGVVCLDARGEMADRLAPEVPLWTLGRGRHDRRTPGRLACILRDWQPHIVHCHNWNTWPDTVAAHAMAGRTGRLIWSFHGFVDSGGMPWRRRIASRRPPSSCRFHCTGPASGSAASTRLPRSADPWRGTPGSSFCRTPWSARPTPRPRAGSLRAGVGSMSGSSSKQALQSCRCAFAGAAWNRQVYRASHPHSLA